VEGQSRVGLVWKGDGWGVGSGMMLCASCCRREDEDCDAGIRAPVDLCLVGFCS
jgi:hypothetical protein